MKVEFTFMLKIILLFIHAINASGEGESSKPGETGGEPSVSNFEWKKTGGDIEYHAAKEVKFYDFANRAKDTYDILTTFKNDKMTEEQKKKTDLRPVMYYFNKKAGKQTNALLDLSRVRKLPGKKTKKYLYDRGKLPKSTKKT